MYGQKYLQIAALLIGCSYVLALNAQETERKEKLADIALRNVLYEQYQKNYRQAYYAAEYHRARGVAGTEIRLVQAAASLELGYLQHGKELISDLDERSLLPENQSRLLLYLARDAYRRRDWILLDEHLDALEILNLKAQYLITSAYPSFLRAELSRVQKDFPMAKQYVNVIPRDETLRLYAQFNLAADLYSQSSDTEVETVLGLFSSIVAQPAKDLEQLMLIERSRVALAEIYIDQNEVESARRLLSKVSVTHEFGPEALAQIARLDMESENYENAAAIWQYLVAKYPWHRASRHAVSGLGYALQTSRGDPEAFQIYSEGLDRIEAHQLTLSEFGQQLDDMMDTPAKVISGDETLLMWLAEGFGHDAWLEWLASGDVRDAAQRWQALDEAYQRLGQDRDSLQHLLGVDEEQQRRIHSANGRVADQKFDAELNELRSQLTASLSKVSSTRYNFDDDIEQFATSSEESLLNEMRVLEASLEPGTDIQVRDLAQRLDRLKGLVRFDIFKDLPRRKQSQVSKLERQLAKSDLSMARIQRITKAAENQSNSVSERIDALVIRSAKLQLETGLALAESRRTLLASVRTLLGEDQVALQSQIVGLQYDMTRLIDRRVAQGEQP